MFPRHAAQSVVDALADTPVVLIHGPRQCGKSTLALAVSADGSPRTQVTLDDPIAGALAKRDPTAFLDAYRPPVLIDEVQRAPELFVAIKRHVDRARTPGAFLLTGSSNVLALPKLSDSLAGRMEVVDLMPLSQGELDGRPDGFVAAAFGDRFEPTWSPTSRADLAPRVLRGGFPEAAQRAQPARRDAWFASYVRTLLDRDVKDLAAIEGLAQMPLLLGLLASRAGDVLNASSLATETGIPYTSLRRYLDLLEGVFLIRLVGAWSSDRARTLAKTPKAFVTDSGLLSHLGNLDARALETDPLRSDRALRNFVAMEVQRQCLLAPGQPRMMHLRTVRHLQVDLVLESRGDDVVGIDFKPATTLHPSDGEGLRFLRELAGPRFRRGVVLYLGEEVVPLEPDVVAVPISALWETPPT